MLRSRKAVFAGLAVVLALILGSALMLREEPYASFAERHKSDKYAYLAEAIFAHINQEAGLGFDLRVNQSCAEESCLSVYIVDHDVIAESTSGKFRNLLRNALFIGPNMIVYDEGFFVETLGAYLTDYAALSNMMALVRSLPEGDDLDMQVTANRAVHNVIRANTIVQNGNGTFSELDVDAENPLLHLQMLMRADNDQDIAGKNTRKLALAMSYVFLHELGHFALASGWASDDYDLAPLDGNPSTKAVEDWADAFAARAYTRLLQRSLDRIPEGVAYTEERLETFDAAMVPAKTFAMFHKINMFEGFRGFSYTDLLYDTYATNCSEAGVPGPARPLSRGSTHNNLDFAYMATELNVPLVTEAEFAALRAKLQSRNAQSHSYHLDRGNVILSDISALDQVASEFQTTKFYNAVDSISLLALDENRPQDFLPWLEYGPATNRLPVLGNIALALRRDPVLEALGYPATLTGVGHDADIRYAQSPAVNCPLTSCSVWTFWYDGEREPFMYLEAIGSSTGASQYRAFFEAVPIDTQSDADVEGMSRSLLKRIAAVNVLQSLIKSRDQDLFLTTLSLNKVRQVCGGASAVLDAGSGRLAFLSSLQKPGWFKITISSSI